MDSTIPQITFERRAWEKMLLLARKSMGVETGGMLLGTTLSYDTGSPLALHSAQVRGREPLRGRSSESEITDTRGSFTTGRTLVVRLVTGPGPKVRSTPESLCPDVEYYRRVRRSHPQLKYLGEWHSHPPDAPGFSERDLTQARSILEREKIGEIICPICSTSEDGGVLVRCFYVGGIVGAAAVPISCSVGADSRRRGSTPLRYIAIEDRVVRRFWNSRRHYQAVGADIYLDRGVAHIYSRPLIGADSAILINAALGADLSLPADAALAVVLTPRNGGFTAQGYDVQGEEARALKTDLVSLLRDQLRRNRTLVESAALRNCRVAVIGLGSIGGVAALELARAGVGCFTLIDPDTVEITNLCRHVGDLADLGTLKVDAVAARIARVMPYARIRRLARDVNQSPDAALRDCRDADAILVATDTENSRLLMNWVAHETGIPAVFAGLLERAVGGRVWRVMPGKSACYQCHPATEIEQPGPVAYTEAASERDIKVEPGLGNDIAFVTHLAVRYVIDTLQCRTGPQVLPQMVFWFNYARENWSTEPFTLYRVERVPPRPGCPICGAPAGEAQAPKGFSPPPWSGAERQGVAEIHEKKE